MRQVNCIYAKRLIDKLVRFNSRATKQGKPLVDIKQIKEAIYFAKNIMKDSTGIQESHFIVIR
ncbi:hypothetical protein [Rickettsia endosymbiont of Gonocerus acuteangulatus]|uniref:hypothetical protein n=1 Tax=Rickettsia endosymbiont of Gonocerus acuteangulatus TaxID=3066266 RepID=UPI003132C979